MSSQRDEKRIQRQERTREAIRTPRAAAVAGILFSLLFTSSLVLIRLAIPEEISGENAAAWLENSTSNVNLALTLVPFAGIAFLWFMGVVRSRLGKMEDQFFSTVFVGSGLLFLAMIFSAAAIAGAIVVAFPLMTPTMRESGVLLYARAVMYTITNVYAIRMAGVFMISLGTLWIRTRAMPRLLVIFTYLSALVMLVAVNVTLWLNLLFPTWVFIVSIYILYLTLRGERQVADEVIGAPES